MQPAFDAFREAHEAIVTEISGQVAKIYAKDMSTAAGESEALKGVA